MGTAMGPADPDVLITAAAEHYAFWAAVVSISLIVASAAAWLFLLNSLSCCCLAAIPLFVHPMWTVTSLRHDNGATLRFASTLWVFVACAAISMALIAIYRRGAQVPQRWLPRFTSQFFLILVVLVAITLALTRPPLSDEIPVSRSLPALGVLAMLFIAAFSRKPTHVRKQPVRIHVSPEFNTNRD